MNKKIHLKRNGAVLPLLAVVLVAMLAIVALTINSNWLLYSQINVQNTADLSARASLVKIISDTEINGRIDRARDLGVRLYNLNIDRPTKNFEPAAVRFGNIDFDLADLPFGETNTDSNQITAVHVDTPTSMEQRDVNVFLSSFLGGPETVTVVADSRVSTRQVDVILCLDASRSMNRTVDNSFPDGGSTIHEPPLPGSRWFEVRQTVALFLAAMRDTNPNARVGLVTFGGGLLDTGKLESDLDLEFARFENELTVVIADEISELVETMDSYATDFPALGLGTSLYDGLEFSRDAFGVNTGASRHVIMLSDGHQVAPRPAPINAANNAAAADITVHTISFGGNFGVMTDIAEATGGSNFSALTSEELEEAFAALLSRFRVQLID